MEGWAGMEIWRCESCQQSVFICGLLSPPGSDFSGFWGHGGEKCPRGIFMGESKEWLSMRENEQHIPLCKRAPLSDMDVRSALNESLRFSFSFWLSVSAYEAKDIIDGLHWEMADEYVACYETITCIYSLSFILLVLSTSKIFNKRSSIGLFPMIAALIFNENKCLIDLRATETYLL